MATGSRGPERRSPERRVLDLALAMGDVQLARRVIEDKLDRVVLRMEAAWVLWRLAVEAGMLREDQDYLAVRGDMDEDEAAITRAVSQRCAARWAEGWRSTVEEAARVLAWVDREALEAHGKPQ
jgi:hypothetical protein